MSNRSGWTDSRPPDISVIVACHNAQTTVTETLESLLRQDFAQWEAICVDDGSTDDTRAVLERFARQDPRFRIIGSSHLGQPAAKNLGIRDARAPRVMILDADDVARPYALRILLDVSRAHADRALVCPGYEYMTQDGRRLGIYRFAPTGTLTVDRLLHGNCLPSMTLVPRHLLTERAFDESLPTGIDWDLWLHCATHDVCSVNVPRVLIDYRLARTSLSHNADRMFASGCEIIRNWLPRAALPEKAATAPHRLAVHYGAIAMAYGDAEALERYWSPLPEIQHTDAFIRTAAQSVYGAFEFVHGAGGQRWAEHTDAWLATISDWLMQGPLAGDVERLTNHLKLNCARKIDAIAQVEEQLQQRPTVRCVVVYGLGHNGAALLAQLDSRDSLRDIDLRVADDGLDPEMINALGFQHEDPRTWQQWPQDTFVLVTPESYESMTATLRAAGGDEGGDFLVLSRSNTHSLTHVELSTT